MPEIGHVVRLPDLAWVLEQVAEYGAEGFYTGRSDLVGPDEYTIESYGTMGEQEMLHMKIVFTRKAPSVVITQPVGTSWRCCPPRRSRAPYSGARRP